MKLPKRLRRLRKPWSIRGKPLYFIGICSHNDIPILANDDVHNIFINFSMKSSEKIDAHIGKYVIMPDHIHTFVSCIDSSVLSHWCKALKGTLSKHFRSEGLEKPFWQEGFFDHVLRNKRSYMEKIEYVRNNPVEAKLVKNPDDWPYKGEIEELYWSDLW